MPVEWAVIAPADAAVRIFEHPDVGKPLVVPLLVFEQIAAACASMQAAGLEADLVDMIERLALGVKAPLPIRPITAAEPEDRPDPPGEPINADLLCICGLGLATVERLDAHKRTCGVYARGGPRIPEFPGEGP